MATLGLLIAGGRGERLAMGTPKALVSLGGMSLLSGALAVLHDLCDHVRVCAPAEMVLPVPAKLRVADPAPESGPLAALVAGLGARRFTRAFVLGVDLPFVRVSALRAMGEWLEGYAAVVPVPGGIPQPLAAWYAPSAIPALAAAVAAGERALVPPVLRLPPFLVQDDVLADLEGGSEAFFNLNTREDLAFAERRVAMERGE